MKNKKMIKMKILSAFLVLAIGIGAGSILNTPADGAGTTPGTTDDPVVTKSYVDQQIQQALNGGGGATSPTQPSQGADEVKNVALKPGKILIADAGTEFIVRSGNAVIYTEVSSGVADLTDGKDLLNGQAAPKNHLLSFPREGRGIQVKEGQTSNLIVMVRGGYTIK
ncbi:hypothetical protein PVOR_31879 [Paenibacillus vortex V453]|uniref:Uncharacterized protein n=1 Tax=Paenibacillus vortex V453 TaxID=715225 RepID=A0A2R9SLG8_9BACL|nr:MULTISPECIES: hypothetical protein [Paenibacillus]AWP30717.1 hypothetical protein B9D94_30705 [Paenibacillus sp. Cedars]EFU38202.1 hypothetical protein PVOR_31879 [Paenibacillus vortex V453]